MDHVFETLNLTATVYVVAPREAFGCEWWMVLLDPFAGRSRVPP